MKLKQLITEYLKKAKMMQIATAVGNQPWACTVYFAYDEDLNLYWISKPSRRHSEEIRNNEKVAGTIVLPHTPGNKVRGIQFQGVGKELRNVDDVKIAIKYYGDRYKMPKDRIDEIINNTDGHVPYKIKPSLYVLFDEENFPDNPRQEFSL